MNTHTATIDYAALSHLQLLDLAETRGIHTDDASASVIAALKEQDDSSTNAEALSPEVEAVVSVSATAPIPPTDCSPAPHTPAAPRPPQLSTPFQPQSEKQLHTAAT